MKIFPNTKSEFPIKLINNTNIKANTIKNYGNNSRYKKSKNLIKIPKHNNSQSYIKQNTNRNNKSYVNILKNIKNIIINIKKENNQNKIEIENIYKYFNDLNNQIQNKLQMFINNRKI